MSYIVTSRFHLTYGLAKRIEFCRGKFEQRSAWGASSHKILAAVDDAHPSDCGMCACAERIDVSVRQQGICKDGAAACEQA